MRLNRIHSLELKSVITEVLIFLSLDIIELNELEEIIIENIQSEHRKNIDEIRIKSQGPMG